MEDTCVPSTARKLRKSLDSNLTFCLVSLSSRDGFWLCVYLWKDKKKMSLTIKEKKMFYGLERNNIGFSKTMINV